MPKDTANAPGTKPGPGKGARRMRILVLGAGAIGGYYGMP